jgi:hypothetical protein
MGNENGQEKPRKRWGCGSWLVVSFVLFVGIAWAAIYIPGFVSYRARMKWERANQNAELIRIGLIKNAAEIECRCYPNQLSGYHAIRVIVTSRGIVIPQKQAEAGFISITYVSENSKTFNLFIEIDDNSPYRKKFISCTPEKCLPVRDRIQL